MVKVISFSLWGNKIDYSIGAIANALLAQKYYPDFECWFYIHKKTVSTIIIDELQKMNNVKIIIKTGDLKSIKPMMWRFEAIDYPDVEIMLSRDTDSRIYEREVSAVNEWIQSGKLFHIMRDHPFHIQPILGGMYGTRKIPNFNWIEQIEKFIQNGDRDYDQDFLGKFIYPLIRDNSIIHATFYKYEPHAKSFPIPFDNEYEFVGGYVYADGTRNLQHLEELIKRL